MSEPVTQLETPQATTAHSAGGLASKASWNWRSLLFTLIKFAISVAILVYLFRREFNGDSFERLLQTPKQWRWVGIGIAACLVGHLVAFFRWGLLVRALQIPFSNFNAIRIGFIGLFFNLVAFGVIGGDMLRAFYVNRQLKSRQLTNKGTEAFASVVADRVIGLFTMLLIATVALWFLDTDQMFRDTPWKLAAVRGASRMLTLLTLAGLSGVIVLAVSPRLVRSAWYRQLYALPKLGSLVERLTEVVLVYRGRPAAIIASFLLSVLVNVCFVLTIYGLAVGLAGHYPTLGDHLLIEPIAMVANAVPLPGGLGGMEAAMVFLYEAFDCQTGVVVGFAFRISLLAVAAIGAVVWFLYRSQVAELMESEEEASVAKK